MRQPTSVLRYLVILLALSFASRAHADDRSDARAHYQAGVKSYGGGDYRGAIREFSAAQQLAPADLNNYNLALCYDKLGDAEPAIQYYRAFLDKQPNTDKRAEIEASINRLEAASRSAASKKAEEARRAEDARKVEDARRAEDARKVEDSRKAGVIGPAVGPSVGPAVGPVGPAAPEVGPAAGPPAGPTLGPSPAGGAVDRVKPPGPAIQGSLAPAPTTAAPTGDPQLDRVNAINIDDIRDQRSGTLPTARAAGGPAVAAGAAAGQPGQPAPPAPSGANGQPVVAASDEPKKEAPVYKKWWFWAIVGVSAYVVYGLATSSSSSTSTRARELPVPTPTPGGLTLMSW